MKFNSLYSNPLPKTNYNNYNKIKVNKNNNIEKHKKHKLLKKIIDKKIQKINKIDIICLTKYFLMWKNLFKLPFYHINLNKKIKSNDVQTKKLNRYKSENISPKKHIRFKYKKSFQTEEAIHSFNSEKKKNSSVSSKKMKILKKYSDQKHSFSTFNNDFNNSCKRNLFIQINKKDDFYEKIFTLIKKIENKNMKYKYFIDWKKEMKKNK